MGHAPRGVRRRGGVVSDKEDTFAMPVDTPRDQRERTKALREEGAEQKTKGRRKSKV